MFGRCSRVRWLCFHVPLFMKIYVALASGHIDDMKRVQCTHSHNAFPNDHRQSITMTRKINSIFAPAQAHGHGQLLPIFCSNSNEWNGLNLKFPNSVAHVPWCLWPLNDYYWSLDTELCSPCACGMHLSAQMNHARMLAPAHTTHEPEHDQTPHHRPYRLHSNRFVVVALRHHFTIFGNSVAANRDLFFSASQFMQRLTPHRFANDTILMFYSAEYSLLVLRYLFMHRFDSHIHSSMERVSCAVMRYDFRIGIDRDRSPTREHNSNATNRMFDESESDPHQKPEMRR